MNKVFSSNPDIFKNAYMNWRTDKHEPIHNINTLAQGYFESTMLSINDQIPIYRAEWAFNVV